MPRSLFSIAAKLWRWLFVEEITTAELEVRLGIRPSANSRITIVALTQREHDRDLLSRVAAQQQWTLYLAATAQEAWNILGGCPVQILFCDRSLPGVHWSDVLQMMISSGQSMYLILVSKTVDDHLWHELIRWGGHDLLATPLKEEDVLRSMQFAWSYWKRAMRVPLVW